ncbi:MAG TPA: phosphoribosyltransferase [Pseudonocardiaceae bacterium]|nr:phosphoribosyltransferase [Pseudonocardiaceae bacterium]
MHMFADRAEAGCRLAESLDKWRHSNPVVLGVPRGGVPVAFEIADALGAELDVLVAHRLVVPGRPPLVLGGIAEDDMSVLNHSSIQACDLTRQQVAALETRSRSALDRQVACYRQDIPRLSLAGRFVILVDDGVATGTTASVACRSVRRRGPFRLVLASPVTTHQVIRRLRDEADEVVSLATPELVDDVSACYREHHDVTDAEITSLLADLLARRMAI